MKDIHWFSPGNVAGSIFIPKKSIPLRSPSRGMVSVPITKTVRGVKKNGGGGQGGPKVAGGFNVETVTGGWGTGRKPRGIWGGRDGVRRGGGGCPR